MFDPFRDFDSAGYLRNKFQEKDPELIRDAEHSMFLGNMHEAIAFLAELEVIDYDAFLSVHEILFSSIYPWAGKDRLEVAPQIAVSKGDVEFCRPAEIRRAVEYGLRLGLSGQMNKRPGHVMGLFAFAHPFLDGNGRTMLLVHAELCYRAGFSIDWAETGKARYLQALGEEIRHPREGHLDAYLRGYARPKIEPMVWGEALKRVKGLDGKDDPTQIVQASAYDAAVTARYQAFEKRRALQIPENDD